MPLEVGAGRFSGGFFDRLDENRNFRGGTDFGSGCVQVGNPDDREESVFGAFTTAPYLILVVGGRNVFVVER